MNGRWSGLDWWSDVGTMIPLHKIGSKNCLLNLLKDNTTRGFCQDKSFYDEKFLVERKRAQKRHETT